MAARRRIAIIRLSPVAILGTRGKDATAAALMAHIRTGRTMWFRLRSPMSSKTRGSLSRNLVVDDPGDTVAAWIRQLFESVSHIHPFAEDVVSIPNDVTKIDAYPELDARGGGDFCVTIYHASLNVGSATDRVENARK